MAWGCRPAGGSLTVPQLVAFTPNPAYSLHETIIKLDIT
jgi:hypothetical protein